MKLLPRSLAFAGAALAVNLLNASGARAQSEPIKVGEPRVLQDASEVVQVVDAFDEGDPFDLHITLGFKQSWQSAKIRRETSISQINGQTDSGLVTGGYTTDKLNVAEYTEQTSRLNVRADIGLYKDIGLYFRLPIILSNSRRLDGLNGSEAAQGVVLQGAPGEQLFSLPFDSPNRSGIEYLAVGLDFGLMNQFRDRSHPTWVLGFEGRFNVSEPMRACRENTGGLNLANTQQVKCAETRDVNRNGTRDATTVDVVNRQQPTDTPLTAQVPIEGAGNFSGGRDPGVSRGTNALEIHSYISKRIKYIEPYFGLRALFEFGTPDSEYGAIDVTDAIAAHPPLTGTLVVGTAVIPWEQRERFQRLTLDFRFTGSYRSEGRDYSPLFDALGSSDAPSLRNPQFAGFMANPDNNTNSANGGYSSVVDPASEQVYFTGLTNVEAHGIYAFTTALTMQAGEFVKFNIGGGLNFTQSHLITQDRACKSTSTVSAELAGPCALPGATSANSKPNANFRDVIDTPGRRFKVEDAFGFDAWLNATVMF